MLITSFSAVIPIVRVVIIVKYADSLSVFNSLLTLYCMKQ